MAPDLSLRRYRPADNDRVREVHEASLRDAGAYVEGVPEPDLEDVVGSYLETGGEFLVGEVDGRRIYDELERRARERGFGTLVLDTMPELTAARRLYESEGFEAVHREPFEQGGADFELLFYRKRLDE